MTELPALGAFPDAKGSLFRVWTTSAKRVEVRLFHDARTAGSTFPLAAMGEGVHEGRVADVGAGALYKLVLDGVEQVDPYARFLPFGVEGPAEVMGTLTQAEIAAESAAQPAMLSKLVIYELHVGAFTAAGTYRAAIEKLPALADLGITALELMPLSSFPGSRGWGYDGVAHFAPFAGYGRPEDLRALVQAAHRLGLTVLLDVVYNHFGPRGNALWAFAPEYFVSEKGTPWGAGPNFAHPRMRAYVLENARYWLEQFGFDGLRLDATHEIRDASPVHVLRELRQMASACEPRRLLIAEDDRNEPGLVLETGLDALWVDDFHHQMRVLLAGDRDGYYAAYQPTLEALATTIERGWTYEGQTYPLWNRPRGKPAKGLEFQQLVYCIQNHDQVGNRALGTRLSDDAPLEAVHLATTLLLFLPSTPMLFMGQEWAASTPFLYFTDHDEELGRQISAGRRKEFAKFTAFASEEQRRQIPDPQAPETFERSKLFWDERTQGAHGKTLELVRSLLRLRREDPVLSHPCARGELSARSEGRTLVVERRAPGGARRLIANFSPDSVALPPGSEGRPLLTSGLVADGMLGAWAVCIVAISDWK